jgi:3-deoxy-7-phosphoheptulonate synthase
MKNPTWNKSSWRSYPISQQPKWPETDVCKEIVEKLSKLPALVYAGETRALKQQLAEAAKGNCFVLQCGDCSEDFSRCNGTSIHNLIKVILQMSIIIAYAGEKRVVNIGRIAGQYAKPRSSDTEIIDGREILSYRGDMVNSHEPTIQARTPDPNRILEGYFRAAATLNLVRAFTKGGYATLEHVQAWHEDFCDKYPANSEYGELTKGIKKAINFMKTMGMDINNRQFNDTPLYTSHEALLLDYEEAMTRIDTVTGDWYDTSAHMLWIGDRTRQVNGAHVEFLRGVCNPIGLKIGPDHDIGELKKIIQRLNPNNDPGRITLITRFGAKKVEKYLPSLLNHMKQEGFNITWVCDPMHGNTFLSKNSKKTRNFEDILEETRIFIKIHQEEKTIAGGVHLELTGDDVTECIGGRRELCEKDLNLNYKTNCDPRFNAEQAVEFAFQITKLLNT